MEGTLNEFGQWLKAAGKSDNSIPSYLSYARSFVRWYGAVHGDESPITVVLVEDTEEYFRQLVADSISTSTLASRRSVINTFLRWLASSGSYEANSAEAKERMKRFKQAVLKYYTEDYSDAWPSDILVMFDRVEDYDGEFLKYSMRFAPIRPGFPRITAEFVRHYLAQHHPPASITLNSLSERFIVLQALFENNRLASGIGAPNPLKGIHTLYELFADASSPDAGGEPSGSSVNDTHPQKWLGPTADK